MNVFLRHTEADSKQGQCFVGAHLNFLSCAPKTWEGGAVRPLGSSSPLTKWTAWLWHVPWFGPNGSSLTAIIFNVILSGTRRNSALAWVFHAEFYFPERNQDDQRRCPVAQFALLDWVLRFSPQIISSFHAYLILFKSNMTLPV